jgi:hypothetical protein
MGSLLRGTPLALGALSLCRGRARQVRHLVVRFCQKAWFGQIGRFEILPKSMVWANLPKRAFGIPPNGSIWENLW